MDVKLVLLIIEHDVRQPDVLAGHVKVLDAPVVRGVPRQLVVSPFLHKIDILY